MSLITRLNDLIDDKLYEEAVQLLKTHVHELSSSEMRTVGQLLSTCSNISKPSLAAELMIALASGRVVLNGTDLRLGLIGLMRAGRVDLAYNVVQEYLSRDIAVETKFYEVFLEGALEAKAHVEALAVLRLVMSRNIPKDNIFWQTVTKGFIRTYELEACREALVLMPEQASSEMIWNTYYDACLYKRKLPLALETLSHLTTHSSNAYSCKLWNLLLRKLAGTSDIPHSDLTTALDTVAAYKNVTLDEASLVTSLTRLLNADIRQASFDYIKTFKTSVTAFTLSKVLAIFAEKKAARESLELLHLLSHEYFGAHLQIKHLDVDADLLKWMLYSQQMLMNKMMKTMQKSTSSTQTDADMPDAAARAEEEAQAVVALLPADVKPGDSEEEFVFLE